MFTVPDKNEAMDPYIKKNAYTFEVDVYIPSKGGIIVIVTS